MARFSLPCKIFGVNFSAKNSLTMATSAMKNSFAVEQQLSQDSAC